MTFAIQQQSINHLPIIFSETPRKKRTLSCDSGTSRYGFTQSAFADSHFVSQVCRFKKLSLIQKWKTQKVQEVEHQFKTLFKNLYITNAANHLISLESGHCLALSEVTLKKVVRCSIKQICCYGKSVAFKYQGCRFIAVLNKSNLEIIKIEQVRIKSKLSIIYNACLINTGQKLVFKLARRSLGQRGIDLLENESQILGAIHASDKVVGIQPQPYLNIHIAFKNGQEKTHLSGLIVEAFADDYCSIIEQRAAILKISPTDFYFREKIYEMYQILAAWTVLQNKGIVHFDIKTNNILVRKNFDGYWQLFLADFAGSFQSVEWIGKKVAKSIAHCKSSTPPKEFSLAKAYYQCGNFSSFMEVGRKIDTYAVGTVFFNMFTNAYPHQIYDAGEYKGYPCLKLPNFEKLKGIVPAKLYTLIVSLVNEKPYERPSSKWAFEQLNNFVEKFDAELFKKMKRLTQDAMNINLLQ